MAKYTEDFKIELAELLNKHSKENGSDTPDYLLANYLIQCMDVFDKIVIDRDSWYGRNRVQNLHTVDEIKNKHAQQ